MMEWMCEIPVGKGKVLVQFTGGASSQLGSKPAVFTTNKPFFQGVIENSVLFKRGKIYLDKVIEEPGDAAVQETKTVKAAVHPDVIPEEVEENVKEKEQAEVQEAVKVSSLTEAQDVLMSRLSVTRSSIRTWDSVNDVAEKNGLKIEKVNTEV